MTTNKPNTGTFFWIVLGLTPQDATYPQVSAWGYLLHLFTSCYFLQKCFNICHKIYL